MAANKQKHTYSSSSGRIQERMDALDAMHIVPAEHEHLIPLHHYSII
jgi:hypothetical protein